VPDSKSYILLREKGLNVKDRMFFYRGYLQGSLSPCWYCTFGFFPCTRSLEVARYRLTDKGLKVAVMFVLFHKRVCGPLARSLFNRKPDQTLSVNSKLETAYRKADDSIQKIVDLLAA
jgi:hypothetical protein